MQVSDFATTYYFNYMRTINQAFKLFVVINS